MENIKYTKLSDVRLYKNYDPPARQKHQVLALNIIELDVRENKITLANLLNV